jgi:hypothetical protein
VQVEVDKVRVRHIAELSVRLERRASRRCSHYLRAGAAGRDRGPPLPSIEGRGNQKIDCFRCRRIF